MRPIIIITGILLFAAATAIIYIWGMKRQLSRKSDLLNLLFSKGAGRVNKYLKEHEWITKKETELLVTGMTARLPLFTDKSVVQEPKEFAGQLLEYMTKTGQLTLKNGRYRKNCCPPK